jgi:RNA polymerase sigma-70 factor (sigma-E family)
VRDRDEQFQDFVVARGPALVRTAYLLTGDHQLAEDLVQIALEKALRFRSTIRVPEATEAYVRRIMYRENISAWRQRRGREVTTAQLPEQGVDAGATDAVESRMVMKAALMRLGVRQRTVLVLRFYEDLTEEQTARAMGVTVGTVKSQTAKALQRLRGGSPDLAVVHDVGGAT